MTPQHANPLELQKHRQFTAKSLSYGPGKDIQWLPKNLINRASYRMARLLEITKILLVQSDKLTTSYGHLSVGTFVAAVLLPYSEKNGWFSTHTQRLVVSRAQAA